MSDYESTDFNEDEVEIIADGVNEIAEHFDYELDGKFETLYELLVDNDIIEDKRISEHEVNITIVIDVQGTFKCAGNKSEYDVASEIATDVASEIESRVSGLGFDSTHDGVAWECEVNYTEATDWNVS